MSLLARIDCNESVIAMAWSPQGKALALASAEGGIYCANPSQPDELRRIGEHRGGALSVAWSPDGRRMASSGQDGCIRIFDAAGTPQAVLEVDDRWIAQAAFSPDGRHLAAAGKHIWLWQAPSLTHVHTYPAAGTTRIEALGFSPDSHTLAAAGYGGVRLLDPLAPHQERHLAWSGACLTLAWRPINDVIAIGGGDASVQFWRLPSGTRAEMSCFDGKVRALGWHHGGRWLATSGGPMIALWDFMDGPEGCVGQPLIGHPGRCLAVAWQHHGNLLASVGTGAHLLLWRPDRQQAPFAVADLPSTPTTLGFAADDRHIAVGSDSGELYVYLVNTP